MQVVRLIWTFIKYILRILRFLIVILISFYLGMLLNNKVNRQTIAYLAANAYLLGCVEAKVDLLGSSDGLHYNKCEIKATEIYRSILDVQKNTIQYGPVI